MIEKPNYRSNGSTTRGNSWPYGESENNSHDFMSYLLFLCSGLLLLVTMPFSLFFCFKTIKEYERAVIFRLGRLRSGARGPGLIFILPCIDNIRRIDLRVVSFCVPPQEILSKDSVTVSVDAVVYFRISNPVISVTNVNDAALSTKLLAQTTLRNILGMKTLSEMLSERDHIAEVMEKILEEGTNPWGVKVERVEVKDIRLPDQLMRVMATEAEATREARAKVIAAEGEQRSSRALHDAAEIISRNPAAVQLRYLQTLGSIGATNNRTIIFPLPIDLMDRLRMNFSKMYTSLHAEAACLSPPVSPPFQALPRANGVTTSGTSSSTSYDTARSHLSM